MYKEMRLCTEDRIAALFQPDSILPEQFFGSARTRSKIEPEKKLLLAILEEAVLDYQNFFATGGGRRRRLFLEAEEWFMERNDDWPFSYESICSSLEIDPGYLRKGLEIWKRRMRADSRDVRAEIGPERTKGVSQRRKVKSAA